MVDSQHTITFVFIVQVKRPQLQLILTFIILSIITLSAVLLIILSKNSRSGKIRQIAQDHHWQYEEFINFSDEIKYANFGLLNYSQNAIFRHSIQADDQHYGLAFNTFDCRAIEPSGIHNSSVILFTLALGTEFNNLHLSINRHSQDTDAFSDVSYQQSIKNQYRAQKLIALAAHQIPQAFSKESDTPAKVDVYANTPALAYRFLQHICSTTKNEKSLNHWLLAHPHLHIEISRGMLLAYKKNQLIEEASLIAAITAVAEFAHILNHN
jgi:hypothetical protein